MKRIISIMAITAILFSVLDACKEKTESETTTSSTSTTEHVTTTSKPETIIAKTKTKTIKIQNEEHSFTFEKTDFEKNYSEEFLMDVTHLVPMLYGYDDYDNWDGSPDEIINDALRCIGVSRNNWFFERYNSDTDPVESGI